MFSGCVRASRETGASSAGGRASVAARVTCARRRAAAVLLGVWLGAAPCAGEPAAGGAEAALAERPDLVKQANAPLSSILQVRLQDSYAPKFVDADGQGNTFSIAVTMPLPAFRLLPVPQLSLVSLPVAVTAPEGPTALGDLRFSNIAVLGEERGVLWGAGLSFVFPTATSPRTGQGKWQLGPAAAVAVSPANWLLGVFAQNPISFAGDPDRPGVNALILQPFAVYQLGGGWFLRSSPQLVFNWKSGKQVVPLDLGVGRVFKIGRQDVNVFVEPFWNLTHDGPSPQYGITFGASLLYPNFWGSR